MSYDGIFYTVIECELQEDIESSDKIYYYFYDIAAGELKDITSSGRAYNIWGYDGYSKVFITRKDNSATRRLVSREKVLGY